MKDLFKIQEKIVPELIRKAELRYTILRTIYYHQPIGRRSLANQIDESERVIRNEVDFLRSRA
jgi:central glycolytic genes regulator